MDPASEHDRKLVEAILPRTQQVSGQLDIEPDAIPRAIVSYFNYLSAFSKLRDKFEQLETSQQVEKSEATYLRLKEQYNLEFVPETVLWLLTSPLKPGISDEDLTRSFDEYRETLAKTFLSIKQIAQSIIDKFSSLAVDSKKYPNLARFLSGVLKPKEEGQEDRGEVDKILIVGDEFDKYAETVGMNNFSLSSLFNALEIVRIKKSAETKRDSSMGGVFLGTKEEAQEIGRPIGNIDTSIHNFVNSLASLSGGRSESLSQLHTVMGFKAR